MRVAILGGLEVRDDDGTLRPLAGGRVRALLARLALDTGRVVPHHVLLDEVWGADPPAEPANALQSLVSRLRRTLGGASTVVQEAGGYRLALDRAAVDATHLDDVLTALGRTTDPDRRAELLQDATALARGPVTPELDSSHAVRLDELVLAAHEQQLDADLATGVDPAEVARHAADLAREHPLHEHLTALLMTALHRGGRTPDALAAYDRLRRRLADELGTDPSTELQTLHLKLLQDAPEPAAPRPTRRTNLRTGLTSFLGRDDEEKRLNALLEQGRLATIVGPGGAGKTRLAGVVAGEWVDRMPDGVWFVELAPVTDAAALPQAFLGSLGVQARDVLERRGERVTVATSDRLVDTLAEAECLVVVDNCEHLVADVATLVDDLLAQCPGLRVLATSREPLGIDGEALCLLPPLLLPRPDAGPEEALRHASVAVFADRARAVDAAFTVDEHNVAMVVDIVRRLDGLPLAIELAAARLRVLPVSEVAARLGDRFRLLTGGSRTAMPRHRTLRAVVEWSWDLLSADERALAERLAVFPGGATVDSAAAVAATAGLDTADVPDLLDALVDKSLLRVETEDGLRYRMLETIREYGTEQLVADGVVDDVRRAHALHHATLVRQAASHLRSAEQLVWLRRLENEIDNILAALGFLAAAGDIEVALPLVDELALYWLLVGQHTEASTWLRTVLAVPGGDEAQRLVAEATLAINVLAGGFDGDGQPAEEMDSRVAALGDLGRRIDAHGLAGNQSLILLRPMLAFFGGEPGNVRDLMADSLPLADEWTGAALEMFRGNLEENEGNLEAMRRDVESALVRFERLGERWGMASCLTATAQLAFLDGDLERAATDYERAQRYLMDFGAGGDMTFTRARIADLRLRQGDIAAARAELDRMAADATSRGERVMVDCVLAGVLRAEGDTAAVRVHRERLLDHVRSLGAPHPLNGHMTAMALALVVGLDLWLVDGDVPVDLLAEAYEAGVATRDMPVLAGVGVVVAGWLERAGEATAAATALGATARLQGRLDASDPKVVEVVARLRATLGDAAYDAAFATGRELSKEQAELALDPRPSARADVVARARRRVPQTGTGVDRAATPAARDADRR